MNSSYKESRNECHIPISNPSIRPLTSLLPRRPRVLIFKLEHIRNVRSVLHIKQSTDRALLHRGEMTPEPIIDNPKPAPAQHDPQRRPGEDLRDGVVPQINPRIHGEQRQGPDDEHDHGHLVPEESPNSVVREEREIDGEEEHVLGVAGGPAVGIAHLEQGAGLGAGLLDGGLDDLVDDLGDEEADGEEHALELAAEDEVGDEAAEADEDGDQGNPCQEMAQLIAPLVPDVG